MASPRQILKNKKTLKKSLEPILQKAKNDKADVY
jgi:hypothetical protein